MSGHCRDSLRRDEETMPSTCARALVALLSATLVLATGCGGDDGVDPIPDTGDNEDIVEDVIDEEVAPEDTTPDVEVPEPPETGTEEVDSGTPEIDGSHPEPCDGEILCFDERTGNPSDLVCEDEGFPSGTRCVVESEDVACCVPPVRCSSNADCEETRDDHGLCADPRFPCVCNVDTGVCRISLCSSNAECDGADVCRDGACVEAEGSDGYVALILSRPGFLADGATKQLYAVAVRGDDPSRTNPDLEIDWSIDSGNGDTVSADGLLTTSGTAGSVTVRATVAGNASDPGDTVTFSNLGPSPADEARLLIVDETTLLPINNADVLLFSVDEVESVLTDDDGFASIGPDVDALHVFVEGYAYVSLYHIPEGTIVLTLPPVQRARINQVRDGFVCNTEDPNITLDETDCGTPATTPCLCYELEGIDVVKGVPDFSNVVGDGEVDVAISGFSLGNTLLDLNFDLIVGPQIRREIPPNPIINLDGPVDVPSGVTLYLNNQPFVDSFIGTAPAGRRVVWSVGGTVPLADTLRALLPSLGGNLDFGPIIAALLPLFADFYSGVTARVELDTVGTFPVRDPDVRLNVPTQRRVDIVPPQLPEITTGWADTVIVLGGVLVPGEGFVPMGISGGTDTIGRGTPDGFIDGDHETPERDPIRLAMSPIHGSVHTPATGYMIANIALMLGDGPPGAPREATSGILTALEPGEPLPRTLTFDEPTFPQLAQGSTWTNENDERTLVISDTGELDFYRVIFRGEGDRPWIVYTSVENLEIVLPIPSAHEAIEEFEDRASRNRLNIVGIQMRDPDNVNLDTLLNANGTNLDELFQYVYGFSILGL